MNIQLDVWFMASENPDGLTEPSEVVTDGIDDGGYVLMGNLSFEEI
jgi:hypothetical protein